MRAALDDAGATAGDIVHVNAHATSTPQGDMAEAAAIRVVLGDATDRVAVSATKSMTGHLLGAAGALESVATVLALRAPAWRRRRSTSTTPTTTSTSTSSAGGHARCPAATSPPSTTRSGSAATTSPSSSGASE